VIVIRAALWLLPFRMVHGAVTRRTLRTAPAGKHSVQQIVWAIAAVSRRVPRATCLTQAFAAMLLLSANGHAAVLRVGVAKDPDGRLRAHAWVESAGETVLGDPRTETFVAMPPLAVRG
jgi:hypothetical protein